MKHNEDMQEEEEDKRLFPETYSDDSFNYDRLFKNNENFNFLDDSESEPEKSNSGNFLLGNKRSHSGNKIKEDTEKENQNNAILENFESEEEKEKEAEFDYAKKVIYTKEYDIKLSNNLNENKNFPSTKEKSKTIGKQANEEKEELKIKEKLNIEDKKHKKEIKDKNLFNEEKIYNNEEPNLKKSISSNNPQKKSFF